jgi:hypothetical protein
MIDQWCSDVSSGEVRPDDAGNRGVYHIGFRDGES